MAVLLPGRLTSDPSKANVPRPRVPYRADMVTALLAAWFVIGLFLDAWAHNNLTGLESFFTPWHAVFYVGFVATAGWICWLVLRNARAGRRIPDAVPVGYGLALLALPGFAAAGVADGIWHTAFGVETDVNILFSPTHLGIVGTMVVIVTAPLRSAWGDPATTNDPTLRRLLPAVLSMAFATTLVLLLSQYGNVLVQTPHAVVEGLSKPAGTGPVIVLPSPIDMVSSVAITNVVLLLPLLVMARRWRVPPGTATVVYAAVAGLVGAITAFAHPETLLALLLAGVCLDGLLAWLRPGDGARGPVLAFATLAPLATWALFIGVASVAVGRLPAVVEMWTGVPLAAALIGLILGVAVAPHAPPPAR